MENNPAPLLPAKGRICLWHYPPVAGIVDNNALLTLPQ